MRNPARQTRVLTLRWMHVLIILGVALTSGAPARPTHAEPPTAPSVAEPASPQPFLNSDGTLKLNGAFSGALDLEGYTVQLDATRGPVFGQATPVGEWAALGEGGGVFTSHLWGVAVVGADVYVAGYFTDAGNIPEADYIAKWDGMSWSALGSNGAGDGAIPSDVRSLAVANGIVYVGGYFTKVYNGATEVPTASRIARWDGSSWSGLGSNGSNGGALNNVVLAIAVDASGNVYAGGQFTDVNNKGMVIPEADYIAKWDSATGDWSALGNSGAGVGALGAGVNAIALSGTDVYAGGNFTDAGGVSAADYVAKWNGAAWSSLGSNGGGNGSIPSGYVNALAVSGTDVYVGGLFTDVNNGGSVLGTADYLTKWNGANWSALGSNGANGALNQAVYGILVNGADVYVGGGFTNAAGLATADYLAKWDGANWNALGDNGAGNGAIPSKSGPLVFALAMQSGALLAGGYFWDVNDGNTPQLQADYLAQWNGAHWSALGTAANGALINAWTGSAVYAILVNGTDVYVGGAFSDASNHGLNIPEADNIIKWDSLTGDWSALGSNGAGNSAIAGTVRALALSGTNLFVGGQFTNAAGLPEADRIAKFNLTNNTWSALGNNGVGVGAFASGSIISALAVNGTDVYAGGNFTNVAGIAEADYIAKWDGTNWSALGNNGAGVGAIGSLVSALAFDASNNLYVGGLFINAAGIAEADYIAKWNGTSWSALGANAALNGGVNALAISGTDLYAGGYFTDVNNGGTLIPEADLIAKWDGANWSALGNNGAGNGVFCIPCGSSVRALLVQGADVYVGGSFTNLQSSGVILSAADFIAKWNGASWAALGSNGAGDGAIRTSSSVYTLARANAELLVGGPFSNVNNNGLVVKEADYIAAYGLGGSAPDITPPTVVSVARLDASPALTASVRFLVTFSEAVGGVDASDFFVTASGLTGATLTDMSGCASAVCTVTVSTGFGEGTLRLDVLDNDSIKDAANNPLGGVGAGNGNFITGETYAVRRFALYLPLIVR